uniref:Uncharacterized protein n=1 Tax=Romanomermis culicivorax TaxID=13658 RepID=A0A915JV67_ROMCU
MKVWNGARTLQSAWNCCRRRLTLNGTGTARTLSRLRSAHKPKNKIGILAAKNKITQIFETRKDTLWKLVVVTRHYLIFIK